jgi:hypothetical protein
MPAGRPEQILAPEEDLFCQILLKQRRRCLFFRVAQKNAQFENQFLILNLVSRGFFCPPCHILVSMVKKNFFQIFFTAREKNGRSAPLNSKAVENS